MKYKFCFHEISILHELIGKPIDEAVNSFGECQVKWDGESDTKEYMWMCPVKGENSVAFLEIRITADLNKKIVGWNFSIDDGKSSDWKPYFPERSN